MTTTRKTIALVAAAVIAVLAVGAGVASAHTAGFASQVSANYSWDVATGDFVSGQVSTERPRLCDSGRTFVLYELVGGSSVFVDRQTNPEGPQFGFFLDGAEAGDEYYVVVRRKVLRSSGHRHICQADRSNTVTVEPRADLAVSDSASDPDSSGDYTYGATLANNGPNAAEDVVVTITVPDNFEVTTLPATEGCTEQGATVTCAWGSMPPGTSDAPGVVGHFTEAGTGTFSTTVTSSTLDPNEFNNSDSTMVTPKQCADGSDNDGDDQIDHPDDTGCSGSDDDSE